MKYILSMLFLFFWKTSFSQQGLLQNVWIGQGTYYLSVDSQYVILEDRKDGDKLHPYKSVYYFYETVKDTLVLYRDDIKESSSKIILFKFLIKKSNSKELSLEKLFVKLDRSHFSHFNNIYWEDSLKFFNFKSQPNLYTDTIKFEKIKFSASKCYGFCPDMKFEIYNDKSIKFWGGNGSLKTGYFKGRLSDSLYNELIFLLKISDLDRTANANKFNVDAPYYAIEVHYNSKCNFMHTSFLPLIYKKLEKFLLGLYKKMEFESTEKFEIEFAQILKSNGFK
ncbi:DUF6438 domain-containing protein [Ferruginibacter sp.]|nr:hypothetical protein [Ferruginibacter sp.]